MTVPQSDTGGQVENTKVIEKTISKELGKTAGRKLCKMPSQHLLGLELTIRMVG